MALFPDFPIIYYSLAYYKEEHKLTGNEKNQEQEVERNLQEQIKAMAKALIVSLTWSGAELLDKKPVKESQENPEVKPLDEEEKLGDSR